jgi:hypothetical protein
VLNEHENEVLVIGCVHPVMPRWISRDEIRDYTQIEETLYKKAEDI